MRKFKLLILLSVCIFILSACNTSSDTKNESSTAYIEEELRQKYPEYFDLSAFKGIEVYVWQMAENSYRCGALEGTNRAKFVKEIQDLQFNSASIEEMKAILSFYDIPEDYIIIEPCIQPYSSYSYQIDDA